MEIIISWHIRRIDPYISHMEKNIPQNNLIPMVVEQSNRGEGL